MRINVLDLDLFHNLYTCKITFSLNTYRFVADVTSL